MGAIQHIVAAARRVLTAGKGRSGDGLSLGDSSLAWDMYEAVPEVGAFADWISNAMSGATLFAGIRSEDGKVVPLPTDHRASQLVSSIAGGPDGQSVLLGEVGTQFCVAGAFWQIIVPGPGDDRSEDKWLVRSTEEVSAQRGSVKTKVDGAELVIPEFDPEAPLDPEAAAYFQVWKPSGRNHEKPTSPVIRSLVVLEELRLLNAAVAAIARSRITGRGVLLVPAGTRFPTQPGQDGAEDSLLDTFIEVASTAIREPESAAATVPIILEVPGDMISGVKWLQFSSEFDAMALQLRDEAIRRFATGADVPAEILMGLGDASHWGAWAITAEALRSGVEPRLAMYCSALTSQWLRPILDFENEPDADKILVWYDTSALRSSSNKGASALDAYDKGLINGTAARRELGFTEADAPGARPSEETASRATEGGTLPVNDTQAPPNAGTPSEAAVAASAAVLERPASQSAVLDSFTSGTSAALAEAVDGLVWSALLIAGRKMILTPLVPRPQRASARSLVESASVHTVYGLRDTGDVDTFGLLSGAWVRVPGIAGRYGLDPMALTAALDEYTTGLLLSGQPHDFDHVPRLLARMRMGAVAA